MNLNFPNESDSYKDDDCYESRKSNKYDCDDSREYESRKSRSRSRYYDSGKYESRSKYYDESRKYCSKEKSSRKCSSNNCCCNCCEKKVKPCPPMTFEACCGSTTSIPTTTDNFAINPISLVCVSLNTECLKDPKVLLRFEAQIHLLFTGETTARAQFELLKTDGCKEISCGTFDFAFTPSQITGQNTVEINQQFSFDKIDCGTCSECTTYSVRVTNVTNPDDIALFQVENPTLTAFAKSC